MHVNSSDNIHQIPQSKEKNDSLKELSNASSELATKVMDTPVSVQKWSAAAKPSTAPISSVNIGSSRIAKKSLICKVWEKTEIPRKVGKFIALIPMLIIEKGRNSMKEAFSNEKYAHDPIANENYVKKENAKYDLLNSKDIFK